MGRASPPQDAHPTASSQPQAVQQVGGSTKLALSGGGTAAALEGGGDAAPPGGVAPPQRGGDQGQNLCSSDDVAAAVHC